MSNIQASVISTSWAPLLLPFPLGFDLFAGAAAPAVVLMARFLVVACCTLGFPPSVDGVDEARSIEVLSGRNLPVPAASRTSEI